MVPFSALSEYKPFLGIAHSLSTTIAVSEPLLRPWEHYDLSDVESVEPTVPHHLQHNGSESPSHGASSSATGAGAGGSGIKARSISSEASDSSLGSNTGGSGIRNSPVVRSPLQNVSSVKVSGLRSVSRSRRDRGQSLTSIKSEESYHMEEVQTPSRNRSGDLGPPEPQSGKDSAGASWPSTSALSLPGLGGVQAVSRPKPLPGGGASLWSRTDDSGSVSLHPSGSDLTSVFKENSPGIVWCPERPQPTPLISQSAAPQLSVPTGSSHSDSTRAEQLAPQFWPWTGSLPGTGPVPRREAIYVTICSGQFSQDKKISARNVQVWFHVPATAPLFCSLCGLGARVCCNGWRPLPPLPCPWLWPGCNCW